MLKQQAVNGEVLRVNGRALAALALLVACVAVVAMSPPIAHAASGFAFADNNNNGVFDPGIDEDITEAILGGYYETTQSIVLPATMRALKVKIELGLTLIAGKNVTIAGDLAVSGYGSGLHVVAKQGDITVGPGAKVDGRTFVDMFAGRDVTIGAKAAVNATHPGVGLMWLYADRNIAIEPKARLRARSNMEITAYKGTVTYDDSVRFATNSEGLDIFGQAGVVVLND